MSLFYFDVYDGLSAPDRVGRLCRDREAAFEEARGRADRLLAEQGEWFRTGQHWQIGIIDAAGSLVLILEFGCPAEARTMPSGVAVSAPFRVIHPKSMSASAPDRPKSSWPEMPPSEVVNRSALVQGAS